MFGIFLLIIAIYEIYSWYKTYIKKKKDILEVIKNVI